MLSKVHYEFACPDGPETSWRVLRFQFDEAVNRPFELSIDLVTDDIDVDTSALLGASIELTIAREPDATRGVFGIAAEVEYLGAFESELVVRLRVVPALTLAKQSTNSRIYQEISVVDVVKEVLEPFLGEYDRTLDVGQLSRGQSTRDYCVQYNESDYDFAVRLLEEEGISFHFFHDEETCREVMKLTDANDQFVDAENVDGTSVYAIAVPRPVVETSETLQGFNWRLSLESTSAQRQDYDFLTPTSPLQSQLAGEADARGRVRRLYDHMQRRFIDGDTDTRATDRLEAAAMRQDLVTGKTGAMTLRPAVLFEPERHTVADLERQYLVLRVVHVGQAPEALRTTGSGTEDGARYENRYECVPETTVLRPAHRTPKPKVFGPQTAIVTGPAGEEIHTDEHGRIKVQFHWEEDAARDDTSSCWVRVAQSWAGPAWGAQFIPRIGMEVVVNFLEANPDRPLCTGCVYNGDNAFPFSVPDSKTQSGWKTNSSPGGDGFNELRFEDAAGAEEIYIHAQKDKTTDVLNNRTTAVGAADSLTVGATRDKTVEGDQTETVNSNKTITVKKDHTETIEGKKTQTVHKDISVTGLANEEVSIGVNSTKTIGSAHELTIGSTSKTTVALKSDETVGAMKSVTVGGLYSEKVGASRSITAVGAISFTAGLSAKFQSAKAMALKAQGKLDMSSDDDMGIKTAKKLLVEAGADLGISGKKKAVFEAADELTLKCGKAKIVLKKNGDIVIDGKKITVKGSGDVILKGSKVTAN